MTFDDDFVRLNLAMGERNFACQALGLEWPPPERICLTKEGVRAAVDGDDPTTVMVRLSFSAITDEDRAEMDYVCRGAEYKYELLVESTA